MELAAIERLAQVVVGAMPQRRDRHLFGAVRRRENDGDIEPLRADVIEHVDAGHARHRDVEEDEIRVGLAELRDAFFAARRIRDVVAARLEPHPQQAMNVAIVVDDEHMRADFRVAARPRSGCTDRTRPADYGHALWFQHAGTPDTDP